MITQMDLIQNLAREQEELRAIVNKLHQDGCNHMKQTVETGDQVIHQPLMGQKVSLESRPFKMATMPRVQQRPRQPQRGNQQRQDKPKRQFTKINIPLSQALQHILRMNLVTLIRTHPNPKTSSLNYKPNAICAYHSNSSGHDTNDCWALKNKI